MAIDLGDDPEDDKPAGVIDLGEPDDGTAAPIDLGEPDEPSSALERATPEAIAAETERQKTGKRRLFEDAQARETREFDEAWLGPDGKSEGVLGDLSAGANRAMFSWFPGVRRDINPAFGEPGKLTAASNLATGVIRSAVTGAGGTAVTGGNPIGAAIALGADRAYQIETEREGGLKKSFAEHPIATTLDVGINAATPYAPGFGQIGSGVVKGVVAPVAVDIASGGVQGAAEAVGEGADAWEATKAGLQQAAFAGLVSGVRATPEIKARALFKKAGPEPFPRSLLHETRSDYTSRAQGIIDAERQIEAEMAGEAPPARIGYTPMQAIEYTPPPMSHEANYGPFVTVDAERPNVPSTPLLSYSGPRVGHEVNYGQAILEAPESVPQVNHGPMTEAEASAQAYRDLKKRAEMRQGESPYESLGGMPIEDIEPPMPTRLEAIREGAFKPQIQNFKLQGKPYTPVPKPGPLEGPALPTRAETRANAASLGPDRRYGQPIPNFQLKGKSQWQPYEPKPLFRKETPNAISTTSQDQGPVAGQRPVVQSDNRDQEVAPAATSGERKGGPSSLGPESTPAQGAGQPVNARFFPQSLVQEPVEIPKEAGAHKLSFLREASPEAQGIALEQINAGKADIEAARRGVIGDDEMRKRALKVGMTPEKLRAMKPGQKLSPEEHAAAQMLGEAATEKVASLQEKLDADAEAGLPRDPEAHRQWQQANADAFEALRVTIGSGSEAGRTLRLLGQTLGTEGLNYDAKGAPVYDAQFKQAAAKALQKKVFGDQAVPQAVIDELSGAKTPEDALKVITREARLRLRTGAGDALSNTIKAGMLTGLRTQARNFGGQVTKAALQQAENTISGLADWAMSKRTGTRTAVTPGLGTAKDVAVGGLQGLKEGWDMIRGKASPEVEKVLDRLDIAVGQNTGIKPLDAYVNTIFRIQGAADLPFRKFHWVNSLRQQAEIQAKNEVLEGSLAKADVGRRVAQILEAPTPEMAHNATVYAEEATYASKNKLASLAGGVSKALRDTGTKSGKAAAFVLDTGILPFRKTPFNIAKDMIQHTIAPLRAAAKAPEISYKLWNKTLTPEEQKAFGKLVAQAGTGAGAYFLGALLASKGLMTGSGEAEGSGQRGRDEVAGRQAGAIKILGKWRRIADAASPVSNLMVLGASIFREATKPVEDESSRTGNVIGAAAKTITETPYFEGIERVSNLGRPGGIERLVGGMASAAVPTLVSDAAAIIDDKRREARPGPGEGFFAGVGKQVQSRLPFLRNSLPPRIDAYGQTQPERALNVIDPTFAKDALEDTDPAAKALVDYNISLSPPKRKLGENQAAFESRAKKRGDSIKRAISNVLKSRNYLSGNADQRREILQDAVYSASR